MRQPAVEPGVEHGDREPDERDERDQDGDDGRAVLEGHEVGILALDQADADAGDGAVERDVRNGEGGRGADDGADGRIVDLVGGEDVDDDLDVVAVILREEGPQGAVGQAGG